MSGRWWRRGGGGGVGKQGAREFSATTVDARVHNHLTCNVSICAVSFSSALVMVAFVYCTLSRDSSDLNAYQCAWCATLWNAFMLLRTLFTCPEIDYFVSGCYSTSFVHGFEAHNYARMPLLEVSYPMHCSARQRTAFCPPSAVAYSLSCSIARQFDGLMVRSLQQSLNFSIARCIDRSIAQVLWRLIAR